MNRFALRAGPGRFVLALLALLTLAATPASTQERFSGLTGSVKDASGAVLPGATVTITNKETGKVYTAVTGADGVYRVLDLEPGRYAVKFDLSGFQSSETPDVVLLLGKTLAVDSSLRVGGVQEQVSVTAESPLIDTKNTTIAHNVTAEEIDRIPKGRSFQNLALASPSVNTGDIEGGIQVNGASGAENSFTVDGVTTNSLVDGRSRQDAVFEYLQEVQVKTGGISAEYGGALGGVVSAVTKSGGNQFHGEGHYYYTGAGTSANSVKRLVLDPLDDKTVSYIQDKEMPNNRHDVGGSLGGPIVKDKIFFFGSWAPRYVRRSNDYLFTRTETDTINQSQTYNSAFGKVNYDPTNRLRTGFSVLWTPTSSTGTLPAYSDSLANSISSSKASNQIQKTRGFESPQRSYAGTLDYTLTSTSLVSVRAGLFDDNYKDTGVPTFSSVTYQSSPIGLAYPIPPDQVGGVGFQNTPRIQLANFDHTKRGYVNTDFIKVFNAKGAHNLKAGFGYQHSSNDVDYTYPGGGYVFVWWNKAFTSNATGNTDRGPYGYYEVDDFGTRGKASSDIYSLYVQDQWSLNRMTINMGLRTERETIPSFRTDIAPYAIRFGFGDKIAPRLGVSYDVRGDGRMKLFGSWGRYYDWTKYELARGGFGGDIWHVQYRSLDTTDAFSLSGTNLPGRNLWTSEPGSYRDLRIPNFDSTDPNLKPMSQDNLNAGMEYQLKQNMTLTVNYTHNNLRRTIEDMGVLVNGSEEYKYVNPGEGIAVTMNPSGLTAVRRAGGLARETLLEQLVRQRQLRLQPPVWQLRRPRQLRRTEHADDEPHVGDDAAAVGHHRAGGQQRQPRVGPRRAGIRLARQPERVGAPGDGSPARGQAVRLVPAALRHAGGRVPLRRQRHADQRDGVQHQQHSAVRERARQPRPDARPLADGPARVARDQTAGQQAPASRGEHPQPVQPADGSPFLRQPQPAAPDVVGDQPGEHEPVQRVRLQRARRSDARRRQRERPAVPDGRSLQPRTSGAAERAVPLLKKVGGSVGL
jgi:hypothetical protein